MKRFFNSLLLGLLLMSTTQILQAQCDFTPTVTGDTLLCPDGTGMLMTQDYDTIQWYKRFLLDTEEEPIPGATSSTLAVNSFDDPAFYFSVEVTQDGCTERSAEVLVDGLVFLPPFVSHSLPGGIDGFEICPGDTLFCTLELPYDTSIVWFQDGQPIPDFDEATLPITTPGIYTVQGAPSSCPEFIQPLGLNLAVSFKEDCITDINDPTLEQYLKIGPNPVQDLLFIRNEYSSPITGYRIWSSTGQLLRSEQQLQAQDLSIDVSRLPVGMHLMEVQIGATMIRKKMVKK